MQVFNASDLPYEIEEELTVRYELSEGSYRRWYPLKKGGHSGLDRPMIDKINVALFVAGMEVDSDDEGFSVLILF